MFSFIFLQKCHPDRQENYSKYFMGYLPFSWLSHSTLLVSFPKLIVFCHSFGHLIFLLVKCIYRIYASIFNVWNTEYVYSAVFVITQDPCSGTTVNEYHILQIRVPDGSPSIQRGSLILAIISIKPDQVTTEYLLEYSDNI